jgi:amidase
MSASQWTYKTAAELSAALAGNQVSAVELAWDVIARIEACEANINAVCVRDFEAGLEAARVADRRLARGERAPLRCGRGRRYCRCIPA